MVNQQLSKFDQEEEKSIIKSGFVKEWANLTPEKLLIWIPRDKLVFPRHSYIKCKIDYLISQTTNKKDNLTLRYQSIYSQIIPLGAN